MNQEQATISEQIKSAQSDQFSDEMMEYIEQTEWFKTLNKEDVLRIEEDRSRGWSGVRGCCDQDTVNANAKACFDEFVKDKIYQYRHMRFIGAGAPPSSAHCSYSGGDWGSARTCRGGVTLKCWAEFAPL
jgi:hypothetical protein